MIPLRKAGEKMLDVKNMLKEINTLYDYGEGKYDYSLSYLEDLDYIKKIEDRYVVTKKWIDFSSKVTREDFISSIVCCYPPLLDYLLWKVYYEAYGIGQSGDGEALYEFIEHIPKFAGKILTIREETFEETEEIKAFYSPVFNGYPQYRSILTRLRFIQLAENVDDIKVDPIGKTPNDIWVRERKISSNIDLETLKEKNHYTLTPYVYSDYEVSNDIQEILSHPWKTFMVVLGMVVSEYKAEGVNGISLRPQDKKNPYTEQVLEAFIYDEKGKENRIGKLKDFVKHFCDKNHLHLFPNKAPDMDTILFYLMDTKVFIYKNGEYALNPSFDDRLYSSEGIIIKNRARKFKTMLKDYIEELRKVV
ncbi:hypothetical protein [Clostridium kluyveri]|uniref:hypothetical protein n=1 Tax=Clostridium kluyveri TaxID=1534 RepID=UPI00224577C5|nr:hypothetical protein [Clostridium kluyveri]UZQ52411.1 hypothetical protein OP486_09715 [Clostridium kluyveri]